MQSSTPSRNPSAASISFKRLIPIVVIGLIVAAIISLIVTFNQLQTSQRIAWARMQAATEFERIAAQARLHEHLAHTYSQELTHRHQQSLASTISSQIDPQSFVQLLAKVESEIREAEEIMTRLDTVESTVRSRENIPMNVSLLSPNQLQVQSSLNESIPRLRKELSTLRSLSDSIQQRYTQLAQQEAEARRLAEEKAAAEKIAAEKAAREKEAELAAAKARAKELEEQTPAQSAPVEAKAVNLSTSNLAPWRPAPPTYRTSTPQVHSTLVVERVVAAPPVFYYGPLYHSSVCVAGYMHYPFYYWKRHCVSHNPCIHPRGRAGLSIALSIPIR
jgi:hypothetical protein